MDLQHSRNNRKYLLMKRLRELRSPTEDSTNTNLIPEISGSNSGRLRTSSSISKRMNFLHSRRKTTEEIAEQELIEMDLEDDNIPSNQQYLPIAA